MDNYLVNTVQDNNPDTTEDKSNTNECFMDTNAGYIPLNIEQNINTDTVSGRFIFNQGYSCTT